MKDGFELAKALFAKVSTCESELLIVRHIFIWWSDIDTTPIHVLSGYSPMYYKLGLPSESWEAILI